MWWVVLVVYLIAVHVLTYLIAKKVIIAEVGRVVLGDLAIAYVFCWITPIGIWILFSDLWDKDVTHWFEKKEVKNVD